jgi:luciferase family oxidoreductase group 1
MPAFDTPLSVLDLAPVAQGSTPADALAAALRLAREVEALGYKRYWVAEHHSMPGIASSAPAVLLARVAAETSTIRLGSGGVMLPNHAPLTIAEQFGMLEALEPGRIDLGIGRAPGTNPVTFHALRRGAPGDGGDLPPQLAELIAHFSGGFPQDHPYASVEATPARGYQPALWLLGSSDYSARLAGELGLPFSFAHHFAAANTEAALEVYRSAFRPSDVLDAPYVMLGVNVVCAPTADRARYRAAPGHLAFLRLRQGRPGLYPRPEEAAQYNFTPFEREAIRSWTASHVIGDPAAVRAGLGDLVARTGADELMLTTMLHSTDDRIESYRLVAEEVALRPAAPAQSVSAS